LRSPSQSLGRPATACPDVPAGSTLCGNCFGSFDT
jgi:hypothetical protein